MELLARNPRPTVGLSCTVLCLVDIPHTRWYIRMYDCTDWYTAFVMDAAKWGCRRLAQIAHSQNLMTVVLLVVTRNSPERF